MSEQSTKTQLLAEAVAAFESGLPEGVTLTGDGVEEVKAFFDFNAERLSTRPRLCERERPKITEKIAACGRYSAALAQSDDENEVTAKYVEAGILAGNAITPTNLCG